MENREKIKIALTEQMKMWREGKITTEYGTIGILEQKGLTNEALADGLIDIIEKIENDSCVAH